MKIIRENQKNVKKDLQALNTMNDYNLKKNYNSLSRRKHI